MQTKRKLETKSTQPMHAAAVFATCWAADPSGQRGEPQKAATDRMICCFYNALECSARQYLFEQSLPAGNTVDAPLE